MRLALLATLPIVFTSSAEAQVAPGPPLSESEAAFLEWAAETAIPVDLERGVEAALVAPLVAGKRFVFLGEPDHYIQEKYTFRLAFLRALHELGWRHLGMEMGRSDGIAFDRYLETGDERALLSVGLYRSARSFAGALAAGGFVGAEVAYAQAVRAIGSGGERVRYFGYDVDLPVSRGLEDALARLESLPGTEELAATVADAAAAPEPEAELELLLEELDGGASPLTTAVPEDVRAELLQDLEVLAGSLRFQRAPLFDTPEPATLLDAFRRREETMFRSFDATAARLGPEAKVVLTGHDMHLSRVADGARWLERGTELEIPLWPTIGEHVTRRFGDEVFALWLVYDHGVHLMERASGPTEGVESVPGTVEGLLARLPNDALLLPLASDDPRSRWLDAERTFRVNGGVGHGHLRDLTDALLFVRSVHPPRTPEDGFAAGK